MYSSHPIDRFRLLETIVTHLREKRGLTQSALALQTGAISQLATLGAGFASLSAGLALVVQCERGLIGSAGVSIDGRSLDSLNVANLRRRISDGLYIQSAQHLATIAGEDLTIVWEYRGYGLAPLTTFMEFSVDSDNSLPFEQLYCFAYDLQCDPKRRHRIRPVLVSDDGISKKIAVPFRKPIAEGEEFTVRLECALPGCMKQGFEYYTSTLAFMQDRISRCVVRLRFIGDKPEWVRGYLLDRASRPVLQKDLNPRSTGESVEYEDILTDVPGRNAVIYAFFRGAAGRNLAEISDVEAGELRPRE